MDAFDELGNTIIATTTDTIDQTASRFEPFIARVEERDQFLRHLKMLHGLVNRLWQGALLLRKMLSGDLVTPSLEKYSRDIGKEWSKLENAIFEDADNLGIKRDIFLSPTKYGRGPYHGFNYKPRAQVTIWRMLDSQFHIHIRDNPSIFLIRQLAMRIIFAAYARNISGSVRSGFVDLVLKTKIPHEWADTQELQFAAELYPGNIEREGRHFGYVILREVILMIDLFELALRQLEDSLPSTLRAVGGNAA